MILMDRRRSRLPDGSWGPWEYAIGDPEAFEAALDECACVGRF